MPTDIKTHLLTVAERLFAEKGYDAVSIRAVTQAAGVNVAAVNYHFGSKEELYLAMIRRHVVPMNEERGRRLDALEASGVPLSTEAVFGAFIDPIPEMLCRDNGVPVAARLQLASRLFTDLVRSVDNYGEKLFSEVLGRFLRKLVALHPDLPEPVLRLRFALVVSLFGGSFLQFAERARRNPKEFAEKEVRQAYVELRRFAAAGFAAPLAPGSER